MKRLLFIAVGLFGPLLYAQVGIGNVNPNATLDISATNVGTPANTDGILIPRMDEFPAANPTAAQDGMMVFITGNGTAMRGFYYWNQTGTNWVTVNGSSINKVDDLTDGKSDNDGSNDGSSVFLGQNAGVADDSSDNRNVGMGYQVLGNVTTSALNVGIGYQALLNNSTVGGKATAVGYQSMMGNTTGSDNSALGVWSLYSNTTGSFNTAIGSRSLISHTIGSQNTVLGYNAGELLTSGSGNIIIGYEAASNATTLNDRLFIQNSSAVSPLIYGEFDNDILRINGTFQVSDPSTTGFALPAVDGSANQILATNGNGQLSFVDQNDDIDWYEANTTNQPDAITDNIYTEGNVGIGSSNPVYPLSISGDETTTGLVNLIKNQSASVVTSSAININHTTSTTNFTYGINNTSTLTGSSISYGMYNRMNSTAGVTLGFYNRFETGLSATGLYNNFQGGSGAYEGMRNAFTITGRTGETSYGIYNSMIGTGNENIYGAYNYFSGTSGSVFGLKMLVPFVNGVTGNVYGGDIEIHSIGAGDKYGYRAAITSASGGTPYGVYSSVNNTTSGYAGYFLGRVTIGTLSGNRYILPLSRGTNGQIIQTDGSGNVTWEDNNDVSDFAMAKIRMSATQVHPISTWTKQNFDTVGFDLGSNFDTTTDRFNVTEAGYYRITASFRSTGNILNNGLYGISVYVNGMAVKTKMLNHYASGAVIRDVSTIEALAVNDYVEIHFFANSALTVTNSTVYTTFEVERIR